MITGDGISGERYPLSGVIKNLNVQESGFDAVGISFSFISPNPDEQELGVFIDGRLHQKIPTYHNNTGVSGLSEGEHTAQIFANRIGNSWADKHGEWQGQRAYLKWAQSLDATCVGYKIYQDNILIGTLKEMTILEGINKRGNEGEAGRVTYYGGFTGTGYFTDTVTLVLKDDGTFSSTSLEGATSGKFELGQTLLLAHGLWVKIQDQPEDYGAESTFEFIVGPACEFLTGQLIPGTYEFSVTAIDEAGNESPVRQKAVTILSIPPELPISLSWDKDNEMMSVVWDSQFADDNDINVVNIYANHDDNFPGQLVEHIITDVPFRSVPASTGAVVFERAITGDGLIRLYVRPVNSDDIELESVMMKVFSMPAAVEDLGIILGYPSNVKAIPIKDGGVRVAFDYRFRDLDDLEGFEVVLSDASGEQIFTGTLNVDGDSGAGFPVPQYGIDFIGPYGVEQFVKIRAYASSGDWLESGEASVVPDSTPPTFVGPVFAVPQ